MFFAAQQNCGMSNTIMIYWLRMNQLSTKSHRVGHAGSDSGGPGAPKPKITPQDIQKHVVKDLPTHLDFMRLSKTARIKLFIPVVFNNRDICKGIKRGGVLTVVRPEVELLVNAMEIPSVLEVDIEDFEVGDTITISNIVLPSGTETTIKGRDFVVANIQAPSGLKSSENENTDPDDPATDTIEEEKEEETASE